MACPRLFEIVDAAHLASCAECRAAQATVEALARPATADVAPALAAARAELRAHPVAAPWWRVALAPVAAGGLTVLVAWLVLSHSSLQHRSEALHASFTGLWGALALAGSVLASRPGARWARLAVLSSFVAVALGSLVIASGVDATGVGTGCALSETLVAAVPLVAGLFALSGFAFDPTRALTAGVGASSAGLLAIHLHCPNGLVVHQLGFHLVPMLALAGVAVWMRRRMTSRSYAP